MNPRSLIERAEKLTAPSPAVVKLLDFLNRSEVDNDEILAVVRKDPVLCCKLLATCNSPAYGLSSQVGSLDQAVLYLGSQVIYRLVLALSFGPSLTRKLGGYAIDGQDLWKHSLLAGTLTSKVIEAMPRSNFEPSVAYTAGLIHDIGKILMNQALDNKTKEAIQKIIEGQGLSLLEAERAVLKTDHAEVGAHLLQLWKLPEIVIEAVANHHAPVIHPHPKLSSVIHVANVLAHGAGSTPGWSSFAVRAHEEVPEALGLNETAMQCLALESFDALAQVEQMAASK
ncbi:MAG: HDOD domain-containing protein [Verrucomicrobia bacterium]|nr:HDOD domain-containing protein [Verrucomicrobiota bacterium]